MTRTRACLALALLIQAFADPRPAQAEAQVAARSLRAGSLVGPEDLLSVQADIPGAVRKPQEAIGLELRRAVYAGRPILAADLRAQTLVQRNQIVTLAYQVGGLTIRTEGRALGRAGAGEEVDVLNLTSRARLRGLVDDNGVIRVLSKSE